LAGFDALSPRKVQELVGPDYARLKTRLDEAIDHRNKIFHGHQKLAEYDRGYRPESLPKSVPSVAFSQRYVRCDQLEQPVAVWLDGKVRKVAPKPRPSGLLTIARLMAESQKNKQEG